MGGRERLFLLLVFPLVDGTLPLLRQCKIAHALLGMLHHLRSFYFQPVALELIRVDAALAVRGHVVVGSRGRMARVIPQHQESNSRMCQIHIRSVRYRHFF